VRLLFWFRFFESGRSWKKSPSATVCFGRVKNFGLSSAIKTTTTFEEKSSGATIVSSRVKCNNGFKSCQVQQLFQVVSSVCFDFVPSRGSPEDNKVWLTLTFSSSRHQRSRRRDGGQVCFDFDFQFASRHCMNQHNKNEVRVVISNQNNNNESLFDLDFES
jgi:hypothetical protein